MAGHNHACAGLAVMSVLAVVYCLCHGRAALDPIPHHFCFDAIGICRLYLS